jgi:hypothetical protein
VFIYFFLYQIKNTAANTATSARTEERASVTENLHGSRRASVRMDGQADVAQVKNAFLYSEPI